MTAKHSSSGVVRSRLRWEDQQDLAWFFVEGAVAFDKSPIGAQLDNAEMFTFGPMVCPACQGEGYKGDPDEKIVEAIETAKKLEAELKQRGESLAVQLKRWRIEHGNERPPWYDDGQCKVCNGGGWIPKAVKFNVDDWRAKARATAYPTGSSIEEGGGRPYFLKDGEWVGEARSTGNSVKKMVGREPPGELLERYGLASRKLGRLTLEHRETMAAFWGLPGLRWVDDRYRGRIWGVMPLTPAGKKLVKQSKAKGQATALTDDQVLNVEAELEKQKPMKTRGALLAAAREQAVERLTAAESAWRGEAGPQSAARTLEKIREALGRMAS